jgi:hypothetical protein
MISDPRYRTSMAQRTCGPWGCSFMGTRQLVTATTPHMKNSEMDGNTGCTWWWTSRTLDAFFCICHDVHCVHGVMMFIVFMRLLYDDEHGILELKSGFHEFTFYEVFKHPTAFVTMQTILATPASCVRLLGWVTCIFLDGDLFPCFIWLVVWNMIFFYILGTRISSAFHIFQRGRYITNQTCIC